MSWFITFTIQYTDWKHWPSQSLLAILRILQELRLQKIPLQQKKKKVAAIGFKNLTGRKFIKTQGDKISELEEPFFYCRS